MKQVIVHIDRLVLRGVERGDAAALVSGLSNELQRLLAAPAVASQLVRGADVPRPRGDKLRLSAHSSASDTGRALAEKLARRIKS